MKVVRTRLFAVAAALLVAIVVILLGNQYGGSALASVPLVGPLIGGNGGPSTVDVIVARTTIAALQPITRSVVALKTVPLDALGALGPQPATAADARCVLGGIARVPIMAGQPILLGQLSCPTMPSAGRIQAIPPTYGNYAIQAPYLSTPTYGLAPGTWVDVTATYKVTPGRTTLGADGAVTAADDMRSSTVGETTLESKVEVTDVRLSPQAAVTIAIPRTDVRVFDYFKRIATFSFTEVSPDAPRLRFPSLSSAQIQAIVLCQRNAPSSQKPGGLQCRR